MLDSKQQALIYVMQESSFMASICAKNLNSTDKKRTAKELEENAGILLAALKELIEVYKLKEKEIEGYAMREHDDRRKEL